MEVNRIENNNIIATVAKMGKPWPGFGPGTFALPRLSNEIETRSKLGQDRLGFTFGERNNHDKIPWTHFEDYLKGSLTEQTPSLNVCDTYQGHVYRNTKV